MKKIVIIIMVLNISLVFGEGNTIKAAGELIWFTKINDAIEDAESKDNIILVNFTGSDWCHWCEKLAKDVFSKKEFHDWSKENTTLLFLDFPQKLKLDKKQVNHNKTLAQVYGVEGFPTILILSKEGRLMGRTGYGEDVTDWIQNVEDNIALFDTYVNDL